MNTPNGNGPGNGPGNQPGNGPGNGPGEVPPEMQGHAGMHGGQFPPYQPFYGHPGFGAPPPFGPPPYGPPPYGPPPYGFDPGMGPQATQAGPGPAQAGFETMFNDMADKSGMGWLKGMIGMEDADFWKGALVGAAVVMLMTNDDLRDSLIGGAAKTAEAMKAGFAGMAGAEAEESEEQSDDLDDASSSADEQANDSTGEEA